jgi:signal transduction histidine kinase
LSDHGLPQFNSIEALRICLKERSFAPFILVTGTVSEEFAVTCLKMGADDYILKSNLSRLPSAIRVALKGRRLETLKREARRALRKQNDELMKVNKELDSFVYSVSHNLRAPLTSVMGLLNLAEHEDRDKKLANLHEMMHSSISKLDETLREIIDYSKNARNNIEVEQINWMTIIEATLNKLKYLDPNNSINWHISVHDDAVFNSDKNRLNIIFNNLLSNAIRYRDKNKEAINAIEVSVTERSATITIKDNGIGIKESSLPKVFDMFYRGTEESQGAGLGLYIVRDIAKKLNGNIEISSVFGNGTEVILTLANMQPVIAE